MRQIKDQADQRCSVYLLEARQPKEEETAKKRKRSLMPDIPDHWMHSIKH